MARKRQEDTLTNAQREAMVLYQETALKDRENKLAIEKNEKLARESSLKERQEQYKFEKKAYLAKLKESVLNKKELFKAGQTQHLATRTALIENNPYAHKISTESLTKVRTSRSGGAAATKTRTRSRTSYIEQEEEDFDDDAL